MVLDDGDPLHISRWSVCLASDEKQAEDCYYIAPLRLAGAMMANWMLDRGLGKHPDQQD